MTVALRSLRVTAGMDAREYVTGMNQKVAADRAGTASSDVVGAALARVDAKAGQSGGILSKLSRQYIEGYGSAAKFESAVSSLGRGIEKGAVPLERVDAVLEGISRKYGLTADASALLASGQTVLANAVINVSAKLAQEESALDSAAAAQRRLAEEHSRMAEAARAEQTAATVQDRYNGIYGIGNSSGGSARDSASVFEAELSRMEEVARRKAEQTGQTFTHELNSRLVAGTEKSARDSASVFEAELDRLADIARLKAQQAGLTFSQELNARMGVGVSGSSARESAAVFEAAAREEETFAAKASALRAQLDPLAAAQQRLNAELLEYAALADRSSISSQELASAQGIARARFNATADSLEKMGGASKAATFQQRNLQYQLIDVTSTLASGMPIHMVFLQQAGQIAQIYGPSEGGVGRAFSETGKMIGGVISKFPVLTGAVAVTTAAFAGMTYEINRTTKTSVGFGDVVLASLQVLGRYILEALQPAIKAISPWFEAAWDGTIAGVKWVGNAIINSFHAAYEDIKFVWANFPTIFAAVGKGAANGFIAAIEWLVQKSLEGFNKIIAGAQSVLDFFGASDFAKELGWSGKLPTFPKVELGRMDNPAAVDFDKANSVHERRQRDIMSSDPLGGFYNDVRTQAIKNAQDDDKKKGGKTARERESDYERAIRRTQEQTKATAEETRVIDLSTYARERQGAVQDILAAAQRDGLEIGKKFANAQELINASSTSLSPALAKERERILGVAGAYAQAKADAEKAEEAKQRFAENMSFAKDTTRGFIDEFRGAIKEGASIWEAFSDAAVGALDKITDKLLDDVMDAIFKVNEAGTSGGSGGGIFGWITSGLSSLFGGGSKPLGTSSTSSWSTGINSFNAKGNVFNSPSLSAYSSQIVDRPTYFAFAKGAGVMGEAGPEGIFPLRRDASGRLGVSAVNDNRAASSDNPIARSVIQVSLSPELLAQVLEQARGQSIEIVRKNNLDQQNYKQNGGSI